MAASKSPEEAAALRELDDLAAEGRRRRFRETTMEERIETALQLGELAAELRAGVVRNEK